MIYKNNYQDYKKALKDLESALLLYPKNLKYLNEKALLLGENLKDYKKASEVFSEIIAINKNDINLHYDRGFSYLYDKQYENAIEDFTIVLNAEPLNWKLYYYRSEALMRLEKKDEAMKDFFRAKQINPNLISWIQNRTQK